MKIEKINTIIGLTLTAAFCVFVVFWEKTELKLAKNQLQGTARIIAGSLWNFDPAGPVEYLKLAAKLGNYEHIAVFTGKDELFIEITGLQISELDRFFQKIGLIPTLELSADISFKGKDVGRIDVIRLHDTVYVYLYLLIIMGLIFLVGKFFIRTVNAKHTLEESVQARTRELAAEREQLAVTLRSIGDGVITTDVKGHIVLMNSVAETLTGWLQEEAVGQPLHEIFHVINETTREPFQNPVERLLSSGEIVGPAEHKALISRDGTQRSIADSGAPIRDKDSRILGMVLVFRDVTEKNKMEEEILKARKLEAVGVLAGGIAHDFNNILAAILGNINLTLTIVSPKEEIHELLSSAEKACLRARDLTRQLLTFSKGGEPVKTVTQITEVIKDSAEFVLRGTSVRCNYHFAEDLWAAEIDPVQISQVIQNIVLNAGHAMPGGGVVDIECTNISRDQSHGLSIHAGEYICIAIKDRGIGIPAAMLGNIFDPYFTTKQEGSGLGLAITHSIIRKHNGHISVESKQGAGSSFLIYLPALKERQLLEKEKPKDIKAGGKAKVMVMDDEQMIRELSEKMLSRNGYEVVLAKDGEQAVSLYKEAMVSTGPIDVIIMDLTIPGGMGGKETVQEILKINPAAKVIVSSGYSNDPILANCREYGFSAAIVKPFQIKEITGVISKVLS